MSSVIDSLKTKLGIPGRRKYETKTITPPFSGMTLKEKLQSLVLQHRTQDREQRMRRNVTWFTMQLYYCGMQSVELSPSGNTFDVFERDDYYIENQFRKQVDIVKQILNKMEGDIVVRPASDNPRDISTARVADPILDIQRHSIGYDKILDQKNLNKCLFGNSFQFSDYIRDKKYGSIVTPKFSYQEMPDPEGGDPMMSKVVDGYSTRNKGRQVATVCSPLEINVPGDVLPFTSVPYIQWISRQDTELLNYLYPGLNMQHGSSEVSEDMAQQYITILANLPGNIMGDSLAYGGTSQAKKAELVRSWFQPCCFRGDKELENEFSEGVHVTTINGTVVDWYEEDLTDRWTHEVLIPVPHSLLGDGLYDAISSCDMINEMDSLLIQHMRYTTVGHKVYDSQVIDPKDVVNDPKNGWIPGKPALGSTVQQAVANLPPGQLSGDVPAILAQFREALQDMTSYDIGAGKSLGANSPYSQSVFLTERAQSRWAGSISYNRPELTRFYENMLSDARSSGDEFARSVKDNAGSWSFEQFAQSDLQGNVDIILSNADLKPRSRAEQVQALQMLVSLAPIIPSMSPKQKLRVEEMLGLPPDSNPMSTQIARAYRTIEKLKKGEEFAPLPLVDDPQAQVPVFIDFLASEEGDALVDTPEGQQYRSNIYEYMLTLLNMGVQQMGSPGGQAAAAIQGKGPQPEQQGQAPAEKPKGTPGGQVGQQGGGSPNSGNEAQSPAPAPPISPPIGAGR